jgi:tRNA(fMet)-specific endonuclease VapC
VGLILDSSLIIADERERFNLAAWLRSRPPEPVAISAITLSELWFGIHVEKNAGKARRRRRWMRKGFNRLEVISLDARIAQIHSRVWAQLTRAGTMIGPHDLIVAATALSRRWPVATFNAAEFKHVPALKVIEPSVP